VILMSVIALVAVVVVGIGVFGYFQTNANKPKEVPVIRVGDRDFDMDYMERWLRYTIRNASVGDNVLLDLNSAIGTALEDVANAELDRRGSPDLGISISEEEIDADIRLRLRIPETADTTVFAEAYRNEVKESGLSPSEYREVVAARLLDEKLRQHFRAQIPATTDQVRLRDILVREENLQNVQNRLNAGEDFGTVATAVSLDTNKDLGGDMGWQPRGGMPPEAEEVVFALEVGQVSEAVYRGGGYYLYQVLEKAADMQVTPEQSQQIEEQALSSWRSGVAEQFPVVYAGGDTTLFQQYVNQLAELATSEGVGAVGGQQ